MIQIQPSYSSIQHHLTCVLSHDWQRETALVFGRSVVLQIAQIHSAVGSRQSAVGSRQSAVCPKLTAPPPRRLYIYIYSLLGGGAVKFSRQSAVSSRQSAVGCLPQIDCPTT